MAIQKNSVYKDLCTLSEWKNLDAHVADMGSRHLQDIFADDSDRVDLIVIHFLMLPVSKR